jgi:malonate transporter
MRPDAAASLAVFLKLIAMPALAIGLALVFGLSGVNIAVVACCASVPAASNAYVLAKQMGGDAPLLAQILTLQMMLAALTMPIVISIVR